MFKLGEKNHSSRDRVDRLSEWIYAKIPKELQEKWRKFLSKSFRDYTTSRRENDIALHSFQLRQIRIVCLGLTLSLLFVIGMVIYSYTSSQYTFLRNSFGKGEKEIVFELKHDGKKKNISLSLEEQELTEAEEKQIFQEFFQKVRKSMKGKNASLSKVNQELNFAESIDGYPFSVSYEPEDVSLIDWNGEPGEKAKLLSEGETATTHILIKASYKTYSSTENVKVIMISPKKKQVTLYDQIRNQLNQAEENSRNRAEFTVEKTWNDVTVTDASKQSLWKLPLLFLLISILLLARNHSQLKERADLRHKQNMEDFPLIVHLLTLYMGAGLSFPSAIDRISKDYASEGKRGKGRYAFEQIGVMNHCIQMGVRPKEACLEWGNHFQEKVYAKFAMLLSQGFSKGSKEIRSMMEKEQQDAFQIQVDYVRREGEEASTRLLFPMIVLLFLIMILIMFPALMQFYQV